MGKGSKRRPEAKPSAYADNYDRIFGNQPKPEVVIIKRCPWCGQPPLHEWYMDNSREIDAFTGELIEYRVDEYSCCGHTERSLDGWNTRYE